MKRIIYLGYYIKNLDLKIYLSYFKYVHNNNKIGKLKLQVDIIYSSLKYNISILEYFYFKFYLISDKERSTYAGTGYMYEYQKNMNPLFEREILDNKNEFNKVYRQYIQHNSRSYDEIENNLDSLDQILNNQSGRLVLKMSRGKCGTDVKVLECNVFTSKTLLKYMETNNFDLVEEYIIQHRRISEISSSGVNTIRIITQINNQNSVDIIGCRFRISINSLVDNLAAGNIAAPIDTTTGKIVGPAVYSSILKKPVTKHPISNKEIVGFQIPFWKETLKLVKEAAESNKKNKSIGWDVVITENGPGLIEGNHDWCKLLWQLPVKQGLKAELQKYIDN